ncbi:peptidyl-tRNA hydrolase [Trematosphaeria pertusa]|uniref:peptidyl-tRNA hydrolase n=1 Tax=Trematosphaeria pertusa TaxID=390896 RepID=A0A6A6IW14_9PLEO|nr:peptidyl-tRNA hydrolase [Trematosphaeria pertusa]KAF2253800.1 peptidyl-tRNA hydrolase [Trematosphaeria pertusa]
MANALTRAHVLGPTLISADLETETEILEVQAPHENTEEQAIESTASVDRKERKKQNKQKTAIGAYPDSETEVEPEVLEPQPSGDSDSDEQAIETTTPTSRKERRKQKKRKPTTELPTPPDTDAETREASKPPNNPPKKKHDLVSSTPSPSLTLSMPPGSSAAQKAYPLLICSLGNPGATYAHTLHSAGHTITSHITTVKSYRPFVKGLSGLVSRPDNTTYSFGLFKGYKKEDARGPPDEDDWTFWQSTSLMNVSGPGVRKAWTEFAQQMRAEGLDARLVVVHDELEAALGKVSIKDGDASARGHNGLKSCQASLGGVKWWRIGVGIGRPESREPQDVSRYVLRKMTRGEMGVMEKASLGVVKALRIIAEGRM